MGTLPQPQVFTSKISPSLKNFYFSHGLCVTLCVYYSQIMMLKLRGHPPILMRRQDGEEPAPFSNTFSKVKLSATTHNILS